MEAQVPSDKFASDQFTSEQGALDYLAVDTTQPTGAEDAVRHALATREDRERRRLEFRSSLMNARASVTPVERCEMMQQPVQQSMRQLSAEMRERRPARVMAELANAH